MRALNREDFPRAASRAQGRVPDCRPAAPRRRTGSPCPPAGLHFYPSRTSSLVSSNCLRAFTFLLLARGVHGTIRTGPRWLRHGQHSPPDRREKQGRSGPNAPGRSQGGGTCRRQRRTSRNWTRTTTTVANGSDEPTCDHIRRRAQRVKKRSPPAETTRDLQRPPKTPEDAPKDS